MSFGRGVAPCGHEGEIVFGNYVQCARCDRAEPLTSSGLEFRVGGLLLWFDSTKGMWRPGLIDKICPDEHGERWAHAHTGIARFEFIVNYVRPFEWTVGQRVWGLTEALQGSAKVVAVKGAQMITVRFDDGGAAWEFHQDPAGLGIKTEDLP